MNILVTGAAGFIGAALVMRLLQRGDVVVGVDNHNSYYDPSLKEARLARLELLGGQRSPEGYRHVRLDVADVEGMAQLFAQVRPQRVVHLAAQAGVRYSLEQPHAYVQSNLVGFANVLEGCRQTGVEHLVYASSSSVYGANTALPYGVQQNTDHPLSLYAASKKANEVMAHSYSHLFGLPCTGLRFFTVYGPWGRPDMALFKFTQAMLAGEPIPVYAHGAHRRDFTYVDDIVEGVLRVLDRPAVPDPNWRSDTPNAASSSAPWRLYNIGNQQPLALLAYIEALEAALGIKAVKQMLPPQPGDMSETFADVSELVEQFGYRPATPVQEGVARFVAWYRDYYRV